MPLLENDVIFAYLNQKDPKHVVAEEIFRRLKEGEAHFEVSSVSLLDIDLHIKLWQDERSILLRGVRTSRQLCALSFKLREGRPSLGAGRSSLGGYTNAQT